MKIKSYLAIIAVLLLALIFPMNSPVSAEAKTIDVEPALKTLEETGNALKEHQEDRASRSFALFRRWWQQNKTTVARDVPDASIQLSRDIGKVSLELLNEDGVAAQKHVVAVSQTLVDYQNGLYGSPKKGGRQSLSAYISQLDQARQTMKNHDWATAVTQVKQLQNDWLAVEGDVVSQSQPVYAESEKNLVMMDAWLANPNTQEKALPLVEKMISDLKPLASTEYGMWDAALIPIREGLEALLVIGALLTFAKKAHSKEAGLWVWGGTALALAICVAVGAAVSFLISAAAFGSNNALINGFSGIIASLMLLYVGFWLHRHADISRWKRLIDSKTEQAMNRRRMFSFAILAFIAVLREGLETVIFLIGLVGRLPASQLIFGLAAGCAVLVVIAFLMLKVGILLPIRPFFIVSSLIVFYLCFKFMGSGIHSLQMAGVLPSAVSDRLPSISSLSVFPSWYSTLPQALLFVAFLIFFGREQWLARHHNTAKEAAVK